jgi:hypothetical protein
MILCSSFELLPRSTHTSNIASIVHINNGICKGIIRVRSVLCYSSKEYGLSNVKLLCLFKHLDRETSWRVEVYLHEYTHFIGRMGARADVDMFVSLPGIDLRSSSP